MMSICNIFLLTALFSYADCFSLPVRSSQTITRSVELSFQDPQGIGYWTSDVEICKTSKMNSLLTSGFSLLKQLRNTATSLDSQTIKDIQVQKLKDALFHLYKALNIARDADLKLGLCTSQESLEAWGDVDKIFKDVELLSNEKKHNSLNAIVIACDELQLAFDKLQ